MTPGAPCLILERYGRDLRPTGAVRSRVEATLASIETGTYEPTPGRWCTFCDFKGFCDAGKRWLAENA